MDAGKNDRLKASIEHDLMVQWEGEHARTEITKDEGMT